MSGKIVTTQRGPVRGTSIEGAPAGPQNSQADTSAASSADMPPQCRRNPRKNPGRVRSVRPHAPEPRVRSATVPLGVRSPRPGRNRHKSLLDKHLVSLSSFRDSPGSTARRATFDTDAVAPGTHGNAGSADRRTCSHHCRTLPERCVPAPTGYGAAESRRRIGRDTQRSAEFRPARPRHTQAARYSNCRTACSRTGAPPHTTPVRRLSLVACERR